MIKQANNLIILKQMTMNPYDICIIEVIKF